MSVEALGNFGLLIVGGASLAATVAVVAFSWVCWRVHGRAGRWRLA